MSFVSVMCPCARRSGREPAWLLTNQSTHLVLVHARSRRRIIPIGTTGRMIEMDHKITVIRDHRVVESKLANPPPIAERDVLRNSGTVGRTFIRHFDVERERALWRRVGGVKNLRHHFVAKIQRLAGNPRLLGRYQQPHILWTSGGLVSRLTKLGALVKLTLRRLLVDAFVN